MHIDEIINRIADSEINRPVEISFLNRILNFSTLTRYPAAIRYIDTNEFYIVIPFTEKSSPAILENALKSERIRIFPFDNLFEVQFSFYKPDFGDVLGFSNSGLRLRSFSRVAFKERIYVSVINNEGQDKAEEIEAPAIDLSGSGMAVRYPRGLKFSAGESCQLRIANPDFPGYDLLQGASLPNGKIIRVFADEYLPAYENLGIEFVFDDASEELVQTNLIDRFCRQIASPEERERRRIGEILDMTADLSMNLDIDTILFKLSTSAASVVSAEGSAIFLFDDNDDEKNNLYVKTSAGEKSPILNRVRVSKDTGGIVWWVAQAGEPALVNDVASDSRFTGAVDSRTGFITKTLLAVPIIFQGEVLGVLEAVNKVEDVPFTQFDLQLFTVLANQLAIVIKNAQMVGRYENFFTNSIELIVKAIESAGGLMELISPGHCWRVAALATAIGEQFGISEEEFKDLYYGAALHDIGFLEQPLDGNGTTDELIKSHPVAGANMVKEIRMLRGVTPIIQHHHERFDGMGYPDGLGGEAIPFGARIVAIVEAYEEMLYGHEDELIAQEQAIGVINSAAGTRFDPQVVEVFVSQVVQSR